jgi:glycosyltransferase involved in cell wall biosynthesis
MSERRATLSVAIITFNEEANIRRTLHSVREIADEIVVVDSHSTDGTIQIATEFGAKVFVEDWKGFGAQKNSALDKCTCDWILSLDADEEVSPELLQEIGIVLEDYLAQPDFSYRAYLVPRKNLFLQHWIKYGGFYPDVKVRLFQRGAARAEERRVHERLITSDTADELSGPLIHHSYPTLTSYIEHMNRYSSLGADMVAEKRSRVGFSVMNIVVRPMATFIYNYIFRLGFLDGKEGLLLHLYHSVYVSWKYAKAWELSRQPSAISRQNHA